MFVNNAVTRRKHMPKATKQDFHAIGDSEEIGTIGWRAVNTCGSKNGSVNRAKAARASRISMALMSSRQAMDHNIIEEVEFGRRIVQARLSSG